MQKHGSFAARAVLLFFVAIALVTVTTPALGQARSTLLASARVLEAGPAWAAEREVERAVQAALDSVRVGSIGGADSVILTEGRPDRPGLPAPRVEVVRVPGTSVGAAGEHGEGAGSRSCPREAAAARTPGGGLGLRAFCSSDEASNPSHGVLLRVTIEHVAN